MAAVFLKVCQELGDCNRDDVQATVINAEKVGFLCGRYVLMDYHRLDSNEFTEYVHIFYVRVAHFGGHCGSLLI